MAGASVWAGHGNPRSARAEGHCDRLVSASKRAQAAHSWVLGDTPPPKRKTDKHSDAPSGGRGGHLWEVV